MRQTIDLNADTGEGFGRYRTGDDSQRELLGAVTSASIACGFHAGDPLVMRDTVAMAASLGVTIGAHPGYPDLVGFGRRDMAATADEIEAMVLYQIGALQAICAAAGCRVRYVKPHGALYNRAARDADAADAVARAVRSADSSLALLGLAGSALVDAADRAGIRAVGEAFIDRAYRADGTLLPRGEDGAVLTDVDAVADRALQMVQTGSVLTADGGTLPIHAESLCVHGDGASAVMMVRAVRQRLESAGIAVVPFAHP